MGIPYTAQQFDSATVNVFAYANKHVQVRYLGPSGVSLHPLQRSGAVGVRSHAHVMNSRIGAAGQQHIGDGPPAGLAQSRWPPVVPIAGTGRDPRVMI